MSVPNTGHSCKHYNDHYIVWCRFMTESDTLQFCTLYIFNLSIIQKQDNKSGEESHWEIRIAWKVLQTYVIWMQKKRLPLNG